MVSVEFIHVGGIDRVDPQRRIARNHRHEARVSFV